MGKGDIRVEIELWDGLGMMGKKAEIFETDSSLLLF